MSQENPFQSPLNPAQKIPVASRDLPLASLWQRFAGSIIDTLAILPVVALIAIPLIFVYGTVLRPEYFESELFESSVESWIVESAISLFAMSVSFMLINGYLLSSRQQTVGKLLMKTKIIGDHEESVPLSRIFLMRYGLIWGIGMIPLIGGIFSLVNVLTIFGQQRKCIHDNVARTRVVSLAQLDR